MLQPYGIIAAMVTPFDEREELNESALRGMVRRLIKAGVHGLFCLGTNGEFFSLSDSEKRRIVEIVVEEANGDVPVYAGAGQVSTRETIALAQAFESIGVDAVSVITPYFLTFTQNELIRHYGRIAEAVSLPIVLYNIPARTGNALQPKSVAELAKLGNITGIKDSSGSYDTILQYLDAAGQDMAVLAGTDSLILPTLMAGGQGAIAATANVLPETVVSIYERFRQQQFAEAELAQRELRALRNAFSLGTLPSVLKEALTLMGQPAGPARSPVAPLSPEASRQLLEVMRPYLPKS